LADPVLSGLTNQFFDQNTISNSAQTITSGFTINDADNDIAAGARIEVKNTAAVTSADQNFLEQLWIDTSHPRLSIQEWTTTSFTPGGDTGSVLYVDDERVGIIGGGGSGGLFKVVFSDAATLEDMQLVAQNITYKVTNDEPLASRTFEVAVQDADGASRITETFDLTVTAENEAPRHRTDSVEDSIDSVRPYENASGPGWYVGREPTDTFQNATFDGDTRFEIGVTTDVSSPGYQGYHFDLKDATEVSARLYIPDDWGTTGAVRTGLWTSAHTPDGTGFDTYPIYPTVEYYNVGSDVDFRVWSQGNWVNLNLPDDHATDAWYDLSIALVDDTIVSTVTGERTDGTPFTLDHTDTNPDIANVTTLRTAILNVRNQGDAVYSNYWDDITDNSGDSATSQVWKTVSGSAGAAVAIEGLAVADRDGDVLTTTFSVGEGRVTVADGGGAVVTGNGTGNVTIEGSADDVNAALAGFTYTAIGSPSGSATITATTTDTGGLSDTDTLVVTLPSPPPDEGSSMTVEGTIVTTTTTTAPNGHLQTTTIIDPFDGFQAGEDPDDLENGLSDHVLAGDASNPVLFTSLPLGVGLTAAGRSAFQDPTNADGDLIARIQATAGTDEPNLDALTAAARDFLGALTPDGEVAVQTLTPVVPAGTPPSEPVLISGSADATPSEAVVIDVRGLPTGTVLHLDEIDFAVIVGDASITGGDGANWVMGDDGAQVIVLGAGDDTLMGGAGDDDVRSLSGEDLLFGNQGQDTVGGGDGADTLYGGQDHDTVFGNKGMDAVFGDRGDDLVHGGQDDDTLFGNQGTDILFGDLGDDLLHGGQGNDSLHGGAGADTLSGDLGDDTLEGGADADVFQVHAGAGNDRISDFDAAAGDRLSITDGTPWSVEAGADGAVLTIGSATVTLSGVDANSITDAWFV